MEHIDTLSKTKQKINWKNFWTCMFISYGLFTYGYLTGIIGSTLSKPNFLFYMGLIDADGNPTPNSAALTGSTTGVYQAGGFFGVVSAGWLADIYGRKMTFLGLSIMGVISQGVLAASQNIGMFIAFRFFTGFVAYGLLMLCAFYTSELSPSHLRGFLTGLCGIWCAFGFAVATYFGLAFYHTGEVVQWRVPLALGVIFPMSLVIGSFFMPESPRYLLLKNKDDAALAVILAQHSINGDEDFARAEFFQIQKQTELDRQLDASWIHFVTKKNIRWRAIIVIVMNSVSQASGNLVIQAYGGILYSSLGFNTFDQLIFQCGYITTAVLCAILGTLLVDRVGRRPLLLTGLTGCVIALVIETAMVASFAAEGTNKAGLRVGVAMLFMFEGFYCLSLDICVFVVSAELFPNHLRAKGVTTAFCASVLTNLVFLQTAPTGFANIGWKFFLVFITLTVAGTIWLYFYLPESNGIPMEEMADVFALTDEVAIHASDIQIDHDNHQIKVNSHASPEVNDVGRTSKEGKETMREDVYSAKV